MLLFASLYLNIIQKNQTSYYPAFFDNDNLPKLFYEIQFYLLLLFDVLTINATPIKITIVAIIVR
jgi:hypothetical protein